MCACAYADYGPDADYYGKPICVSANENHIDIVDMSVPFSPKSISKLYGCGGDARTKAPEPFPPVECDASVPCLVSRAGRGRRRRRPCRTAPPCQT